MRGRVGEQMGYNEAETLNTKLAKHYYPGKLALYGFFNPRDNPSFPYFSSDYLEKSRKFMKERLSGNIISTITH